MAHTAGSLGGAPPAPSLLKAKSLEVKQVIPDAASTQLLSPIPQLSAKVESPDRRLLLQGQIFKMLSPRKIFGARTKPRFLYCSTDLSYLIIAKVKEGRADPSAQQPLSTNDIVDVALGLYHVSQAETERLGAKPARCITLLCSNGLYLYLEADKEEVAQAWFRAFIWLKKFLSDDLRSAFKRTLRQTRVGFKMGDEEKRRVPPEIAQLRLKKRQIKIPPTLTHKHEQFAYILRHGQYFLYYPKRKSKPTVELVSCNEDLSKIRWVEKPDGQFLHSLPSMLLQDVITGEKCEIFGKSKWCWTLSFSPSGPGESPTLLNLSADQHKERSLWTDAFRWLREVKSNVSAPYNVTKVSSLSKDLQWKGKDVLLQFKLGRRLGKGGFSEVYSAVHQGTGSKLAVKIVNDSTEETRNEIDILKRLRHDNIASFFGSLPDDSGRLYVLMEYCDAGSLLDLLNRAVERPIERHIAYIMRSVLHALAYLHKQGIIHRDIKAANILLTKAGQVKLTDFGISAQLKRAELDDAVIAGSPLWMPPEAIRGDVTPASDIWSLGITAIEMATGHAPLHHLITFPQIAAAILTQPPPRLDGNWSPQFKDMVAKCVVADMSKRASIQDLLEHPFLVPPPQAHPGVLLRPKGHELIEDDFLFFVEQGHYPDTVPLALRHLKPSAKPPGLGQRRVSFVDGLKSKFTSLFSPDSLQSPAATAGPSLQRRRASVHVDIEAGRSPKAAQTVIGAGAATGGGGNARGRHLRQGSEGGLALGLGLGKGAGQDGMSHPLSARSASAQSERKQPQSRSGSASVPASPHRSAHNSGPGPGPGPVISSPLQLQLPQAASSSSSGDVGIGTALIRTVLQPYIGSLVGAMVSPAPSPGSALAMPNPFAHGIESDSDTDADADSDGSARRPADSDTPSASPSISPAAAPLDRDTDTEQAASAGTKLLPALVSLNSLVRSAPETLRTTRAAIRTFSKTLQEALLTTASASLPSPSPSPSPSTIDALAAASAAVNRIPKWRTARPAITVPRCCPAGAAMEPAPALPLSPASPSSSLSPSSSENSEAAGTALLSSPGSGGRTSLPSSVPAPRRSALKRASWIRLPQPAKPTTSVRFNDVPIPTRTGAGAGTGAAETEAKLEGQPGEGGDSGGGSAAVSPPRPALAPSTVEEGRASEGEEADVESEGEGEAEDGEGLDMRPQLAVSIPAEHDPEGGVLSPLARPPPLKLQLSVEDEEQCADCADGEEGKPADPDYDEPETPRVAEGLSDNLNLRFGDQFNSSSSFVIKRGVLKTRGWVITNQGVSRSPSIPEPEAAPPAQRLPPPLPPPSADTDVDADADTDGEAGPYASFEDIPTMGRSRALSAPAPSSLQPHAPVSAAAASMLSPAAQFAHTPAASPASAYSPTLSVQTSPLFSPEASVSAPPTLSLSAASASGSPSPSPPASLSADSSASGSASGPSKSTSRPKDKDKAGRRAHPRVDVKLSPHDLIELGVIGRGQNGKVVKALHLPSLRFVALKRINAYNAATRHQLLKELAAYASLESPYLVSFLGAFFDQGQIALASEFMDCGSLKSFVRRNGPLSEDVLKHITRKFVLGLDYLHSHFQVHRDIKPDNILLNHRGQVKIADFGLLKQLNGAQAATDTFLGTMAYLSPERIKSQDYSYASDIWSLGISIIFCATGHLPIDVTDYWVLVDNITNKPAPSLPRNKFSADLCDFVAACLVVDPDHRATSRDLLAHPFLRHVTDTTANPVWKSKSNDFSCFVAVADLILDQFARNSDRTYQEDFKLDADRVAVLADEFALTPEQVRETMQERLRDKLIGKVAVHTAFDRDETEEERNASSPGPAPSPPTLSRSLPPTPQ